MQTDPALLRSIVQNFLSNAIKYTQSGAILVAMRRRGGDVRIDVIDTGPGIDAPDHLRIFKEFERLPSAEGGGIGLGLAIVSRTARVLGATISMHSALGQGSRFSIALPAYQPQIGQFDQPTVDPILSDHSKSEHRLRVLIIEDDPANQEAMAAFLGGLCHSCICFSTGEQALKHDHNFDVGLIDFNLGLGMDGLSVIESLHKTNPSARFALTTAAPETALKARMDGQGVTYFRKPIDPHQLEKWLHEIAQLEQVTVS